MVDDDTDLCELIGNFLRGHGLAVCTALDGVQLDAKLAVSQFDLIVLDQMMPGEDGLSIVRRLAGPRRPAIIMLSAMGEDVDRIRGLEIGVDDYLAKPCNPRELLARIRSVLRRRQTVDAPLAAARHCRFGRWSLDLISRILSRVGAESTQLTDAEFRVLTALLDRPLQPLSRDQLLDAARGEGVEVFDRAIDVAVSRLRRKLGPDDPIRTVRNEGYMSTVAIEGD